MRAEPSGLGEVEKSETREIRWRRSSSSWSSSPSGLLWPRRFATP